MIMEICICKEVEEGDGGRGQRGGGRNGSKNENQMQKYEAMTDDEIRNHLEHEYMEEILLEDVTTVKFRLDLNNLSLKRSLGFINVFKLVVAMSTTEAKYVAAAQASKEAVWLKMLLEEPGHEQEKITLFCDNESALYLARNPTFHSKTKHIRVQYHFVRDQVEEEIVDMQKFILMITRQII
ncbi:hypothetical protein Tco_0852282 [Tanacetum coccineum]